MADIWTILAVVGGGLIGAAVLTKITGLDSYLSNFFSALFSAIQSAVSFVLDNLPRPVKALVFILLFIGVGGLVYNFTIGAQYVCIDDDVYKVDYIEGVAAQLFPPEFDPEQGTTAEQQEIMDQISSGNYTNVTSVGIDAWKIVTPGVFIGALQKDVDSETYTQEDILYQVDDVTFGTGTGQRTYDAIVFGVFGEGDIMTRILGAEVWDTPRADFFQDWLGEDRIAKYEICRDGLTNACTLRRQDILDWDNVIPGISDGRGAGCIGLTSSDAFSETVGVIQYTHDVDDGLLVGLTDYTRFGYQAFTGSDPIEDQFGCTQLDRADREDAGTELVGARRDILGSVDQPRQPTKVKIHYDVLFGGTDFVYVPLYGVQYSPIMVSELYSNETFANLLYEYNTRTNSIDPTDRVTPSTYEDLFQNPSQVIQSGNELITYTCKDTTENPADTQMEVMGIDPFNPLVIIFLMAISALVAIYSKFGVFG